MACVIEGITLTPAAIRTDRRRGYLVAINNCGRSVELALQTCRAAAFPCEHVEGLLREARELMDQAVQLGHPTEWTRDEDLEALRLMGDASTLATRAAGHVWIGCGAGGAAAVEANDPSVAHAAAEQALAEVQEGRLRASEPASQLASDRLTQIWFQLCSQIPRSWREKLNKRRLEEGQPKRGAAGRKALNKGKERGKHDDFKFAERALITKYLLEQKY